MIVEVKGLVKSFQEGPKVLDGLDLLIKTPEFLVISGANGSGKSMLIRHILGLEKPDAGGVSIDGVALRRCLSSARKRMALVFQEPEHQILGVTVAEDVGYSLRARGVGKAELGEAIADALRNAGLSGYESRLSSALSGGEKRRLALASALASRPELIILDEPFNDLDWSGASDLLEVLLNLHASGIGILVVTHDLEKCLAHADRLVVMRGGRVIGDGPPDQLWDSLPGLGIRRLPGSAEQLANMTWLRSASQA